MRYVGWHDSPRGVRVMSEGGLTRLTELQRRHQAEIAISSERIRAALTPVLASEIHEAVANLVGCCAPDQSDAALAYLSAVLEQPTATAAKTVDRPQIFGNGKSGQLEAGHWAMRGAFTRVAALEALRLFFETGSQSPWKNAKSLSIAKVSSFDFGIDARISCTACSGLGKFRLSTLDTSKSSALLRGRFNCCSCGHWVDTTDAIRPAEDKQSSWCQCQFCTNLNQSLTSEIRKLIASESPKLIEEYQREVVRLVRRQTAAPDAESMRRDWIINKNDPNKALRALIEMKPKDGNDFNDCLDKYLARHNGKRKEILGLALRHNLIYAVSRQWLPECRSYSDLLTEAAWPVRCSDTNRWIDDERAKPTLKAIASWLCDTSDNDTSICKLEVGEQAIYVHHGSRKIELVGASSGWMFESIHPRTETALAINPYFLKEEAANNQIDAATAVRVFRSETECRAFHRIRSERPDSIVVPNYPMWRLIDLRQLKAHFASEDWSYLQTCELDLVVCDEAGYVSYVEEVQRGDHHNEPEWIRKDSLKRQALQLAGIPFRESF